MVFTMRGLIRTGSLLLLTMVMLLNVGPAAAGGPYDLEFRGADVKVTRIAPLGDPIEFLVRGYNLSLRKNEAYAVQVKVA